MKSLLRITFGVHVQAVGLAAVVGSHIVVTDGNVKGVTPGDVVSQRFPVHCYQTGPGLSNLQPLWSPHRFYRWRKTTRKGHKPEGSGNKAWCNCIICVTDVEKHTLWTWQISTNGFVKVLYEKRCSISIFSLVFYLLLYVQSDVLLSI